jgi:hypothetical protein
MTDDSSGEGPTDVIMKFMEKKKREMKRCKGQGKDSAVNVNGKNSREYYIKICLHFYDVLGPNFEALAM